MRQEIKTLLTAGAAVDSKALSAAAGEGHESIVKLLVEPGAEIYTREKYYEQKTPLSLAAEGGHEGIVKLLFDSGAKIDSRDNCARTPLILAANKGHKNVVSLLLSSGADVDERGGFLTIQLCHKPLGMVMQMLLHCCWPRGLMMIVTAVG
jgi:ankyrin repeat protein